MIPFNSNISELQTFIYRVTSHLTGNNYTGSNICDAFRDQCNDHIKGVTEEISNSFFHYNNCAIDKTQITVKE